MTTVDAVHGPAGSPGRPAAVAAGACAAVHVWLLASGGTGFDVVVAFSLVLLSAFCLLCVPALWRAPTPRTWRTVRLLASAAVALHLLALVAPTGGRSPGGAETWVVGHPSHALLVPAPVGLDVVQPGTLGAAAMALSLGLGLLQAVLASRAMRLRTAVGAGEG